MKTCPDCKVVKSRDEFPKSNIRDDSDVRHSAA
jgi:hypothetical protein